MDIKLKTSDYISIRMLDSDKDTTTKPLAILKEKLQHVSHPCAIIGRIIKYRTVMCGICAQESQH